MNIKNIFSFGVALLMATPTFSATPDNNDGTQQTLTVNQETIDRTVSEIQLDGNNAVLLFTDGTTLTADMRLVTLTMSYEEATGVTPLLSPEGEEGASPRGGLVGAWYTLDGIKVTVMPKQKGIYIHNGKKVVNKK